MAVVILPVVQSLPNYRFACDVEGVQYIFDARWNTRDLAWFMDVYDVVEAPIRCGIKIVIGTYLGRSCNHPLFRAGVFMAIDSAGTQRDAGLDDLGARVQLVYVPQADLLAILTGVK